MSQPLRYVATTSGGLEAVLEGELRALGATRTRRSRGSVGFEGDRALMVRACLELRTAHRVLWELGSFGARDPESLYRGVRKLVRWQGLIPPDKTFAVQGTARDGKLRDGRYVALKTKDAIADAVRDAVGARPSVDVRDPDVRVVVRVVRDRADVALDAAGQSLHARGYRTEAGVAPLRETLAAGMLLLARYGEDPALPLVDPMCGAGTLPVEAALLARGMVPGLLDRSYGFERWPGHRPARLEKLRAAARDRVKAPGGAGLPILGADRDAGVLQLARRNAERAGCELQWRASDVARLDNPWPDAGEGLVVCNPPYGERLEELEALRPTFEAMGRTLRERFAGWTAWVLVADDSLQHALGLDPVRRVAVKNGALDVTLTCFAVPR